MVTRTLAFALSTLAACWLVGAAPSGAALSTTDSRFGPDTLVEDTATGLDWLILPTTQGFSVDQILTATKPGGSFEEFRLATRDELVTLLDALSIPFNGTCFGACFINGQQFVSVFQGNGGLLGPVTVVEPGLVELFSFHISLYPDNTEAFGDLQLVSRVLDIAFSGDRFFLVADQTEPPVTVTVPEPGSVTIVVASLGWLALLARRRVTAIPWPNRDLS